MSSLAIDMVNLSNSDRFKILRKWELMTYPSATAVVPQAAQEPSEGEQCRVLTAFVKLKDMVTQFNSGNAGTVADMTTGSLWLVTHGTAANAAESCQLTYCTRVRYDDF